MKKSEKTGNTKVELESVEPLTPHNEALYEAAKDMLKSSLNTARDFCKFMITISTGAIPTYLALLKFVLPEELILPPIKLVLSIIPPFLFLVSAIIFVFGYFPRTHRFSLDIIEEIKSGYEETIAKRNRFIKWGMSVFLIGSISAILSIVVHTIGI